jgi:N-acetylglucosaminyl-diphospho-decaprenol L-rhamnosyltransferase
MRPAKSTTADVGCPAPLPEISRAAERVAVVLPVFNQLEYTRGCVESLGRDIAGGLELIVVNNGSTDGTGVYLSSLPRAKIARNQSNLGCARAWNQGVQLSTREWTVLLNNDVVAAPGWLEGLVEFAGATAAEIVAPALREGPLNYPFPEYAADFMRRMRAVRRWGEAHGICFMVRRRVFEAIGEFDENFRIGQFEDADFFLRAKLAGVKMGVTGGAFVHHFGSVTQQAIREAPPAAGSASYYEENRAYYLHKWGLNPLRRMTQRWGRRTRNWRQRTLERLRHGHSLYEKWIDGRLQYY